MIEYNHLSVLGRLYVGIRAVLSPQLVACVCVCGVGGVSVYVCVACENVHVWGVGV